MVPDLDEALLGGTLDMWGDAMEGSMPYGITEAAITPLRTVLIGMIRPITVTLPTVIPGDARAYLFLPLFDGGVLHAPCGVGIATITPPRFRSTVVAGTYVVAKATTKPLLLVSMVTWRRGATISGCGVLCGFGRVCGKIKDLPP